MATLTGQPIDQSYSGLLKTEDNGVIGAVAKGITDGVGGVTNMTIATTATNFVSGTVDFTGATVSGLPSGGAAGLESGTGTDSMQSAASLTTVAADAAGANGIALGANARVNNVTDGGIAIGLNTNSAPAFGTAPSIVIGKNASAARGGSLVIGESATASDANGTAIGSLATTTNNNAVAVGYQATANNQAVALGLGATAGGTGRVALGYQVTAGYDNTASVKALETQTDSTPTAGGIIMSDAGGTDRRINIDAAGGLQIDSTAVGGGGLESGTGADSMQSAASLTTVASAATGAQSIALGNGAITDIVEGIAIGNGASTGASSTSSIVIGASANGTTASDTIYIGNNIPALAYNGDKIIIGHDPTAAGRKNVQIGNDTQTSNDFSVVLGHEAKALQGRTVTIGYQAQTGNGFGAIAIGDNASTTTGFAAAVALGQDVVAGIANTVSIKALEVQTDSTPTAGGIIMSDAGGTDRRINIDATGNLQVDSTVVGAPTVFKLPRVGGLVQASGCDVIQSSVLIPGGTMQAGDMWQLNGADSATGSTGFVYSAYWISTTGTIGGTATEEMNLGQQESQNASWSLGYQKTLYIGTQDGTGIGTEIVCSGCPSDVNGDFQSAMVTDTPDWTNDLYLVTRICVDNAGATYVNHGATLRKIN